MPSARRLFVGNLSSKVTWKEVHDFFQGCGSICRIRFPKNTSGFCYVYFVREEDAQEALTRMNNQKLKGRKVLLNVVVAIEKNENLTTYVIQENNILFHNVTVPQIVDLARKICRSKQTVVSEVYMDSQARLLLQLSNGTPQIRYTSDDEQELSDG